MRPALMLLLAIVVALSLVSSPALAQETYTATDLGTLGGNLSEAVALNDAGAIAGNSNKIQFGPTHAFIWQNGTMTDLGTAQDEWSKAVAINGNGQVIGISQASGNSAPRGFLWQSGVRIDLGTLGGTTSTPVAINDSGEVVGYSTTASGPVHGFIWRNGVMSDVGTVGTSDTSTQALDINNAGQVVGVSNYRAFLWKDGQITDLGDVPTTFGIPGGGMWTGARINEAGEIAACGGPGLPRIHHNFIWKNGGFTATFDQQNPFHADGNCAVDINDAGAVAGEYSVSYPTWAYTWNKGTTTYLGTVGNNMWSHVTDMNNNGEIVGYSWSATSIPRSAYVWKEGIISPLPVLFAGESVANAINGSGNAAGLERGPDSSSTRAILWTKKVTLPTVAASPQGGDFSGNVTVSLTASEPATIYYTVDGSTPAYPVSGTTQTYQNPLQLQGTTMLRFFARDRYGNSGVVQSEAYTISAPTPVTPPIPVPVPPVAGSADQFQVAIAFAGTGSGSVTAFPVPPGRGCTSTCSQAFSSGTAVSITPAATAGSMFSGWSGCDTVNDITCTVVMSGARAVTATFSATPSGQGQTITFPDVPLKEMGTADFQLEAVASSGLPIKYASSNPAVATIAGRTVHITGTGQSIITASQPGDSTYSAAADVSRTLTVAPPLQVDDVLAALRMAIGRQIAEPHIVARCDVSPLGPDGKPQGDGKIEMSDVMLVLQHLAGIVAW